MGGSISVKNETELPLLISLEQVTPLYWEVVQPGGTFYRKTGAVHFTIKAKVSFEDTINVVKDCVLPIAAVSALAVTALGLALVAAPALIGASVAIGVAEEATLIATTTAGSMIAIGSGVSAGMLSTILTL